MRVLPHRRRQERRGLDAVLPHIGRGPSRWQRLRQSAPASHPLTRRTRFMKIIGAVVLTSLVLLPVRWQPGMTATNDPKIEKVVDTSGNLRVPGDYRTAYEFLGSWAVSAD